MPLGPPWIGGGRQLPEAKWRRTFESTPSKRLLGEARWGHIAALVGALCGRDNAGLSCRLNKLAPHRCLSHARTRTRYDQAEKAGGVSVGRSVGLSSRKRRLGQDRL